ncbi:MAG: hypothetical protein ACHQ52_05230, partial [Candidatus Eisenbacteria bacterium]
MGLEFLARVRHTSSIAGFVAALFAAAYFRTASGIAIAAGVAWSIANLSLLETIVVAMTGPRRRERDAMTRAALGAAGTLALLGAAAWLLPRLPLVAVAIGFTIPFAVMVLKAGSMLLIESGAWRRLTESRWRPALLVGLGLAVALVVVNLVTGPSRAATAVPDTVAHAGAVAGAPDSHAGGNAGAAHQEAESGPSEFPTLVGVLAKAGQGTAWGEFLHHYEAIVYSLLVAVLVSIVLIAAARRTRKVPGGVTNAIEYLVEKLHSMVLDTLGPRYGP